MISFIAEQRIKIGTRYSRNLRRLNKLPAIIYGDNQKKSIPIFINNNDIKNIQFESNFYNNKISIKLDDYIYIVKIHAVQKHAFKLQLIHIDFLICS
ncbi:50S ribosomal protein L25 [Buchnera aphidicola (Neophyllaphis podocarpi)]|uniref:50S ribosomal protein L25 n=1 Tax=Buchnera aphidicola TaxID=9 RepID=UPI0031B88C65